MTGTSDVDRAARLTAEFLSCIGAFEAEFDYVFHVLKRHGVRESDLEDLVQEVFLVMWRRWGEFDLSRPLRPWLAGISFRVAYNHRQRIGRELPGGLIDLADDTPNPEESVAAQRARVLVRRVLAALPEKHRELILSHDVEGVPVREIAETLEVPVPTAHSRLRAARMAFAKSLRRFETVSATKAQLAPLLRPEILAEDELTPVPTETKRRALSRARVLLLLPGPREAGHEAARAGEAAGVRPASPARIPATSRLAAGAALATVTTVGALALLVARAPGPVEATERSETAGAEFGQASRTFAQRGRGLETLAATVPQVTRFAPPPPMTSVLAQGLIGYWRFDEASGSRVAHDLSGNGNDCVLRRLEPTSAWTAGPLGGALELDGQGWLECPRIDAVARLSNQLTIAMWVKRTGKGAGVRALVTRQRGRDELDAFHFGFRDDALWLRSERIAGGPASGPFPAARGRWYHVAATFDAEGTGSVFINGEPIRKKQKEGRPSLGGGTNPLLIGGGANRPDPGLVEERLEGVIDELVIYDRAIGEAELHALVSGVQPRVPEAPSPTGLADLASAD